MHLFEAGSHQGPFLKKGTHIINEKVIVIGEGVTGTMTINNIGKAVEML